MALIDTDFLVAQTARKLGLSKTLVKSIINDCYSGVREELKNPTSPALLIHKFGTIEVIPNTLKAHIHQRHTINGDPEKLQQYVELLNKSYE